MFPTPEKFFIICSFSHVDHAPKNHKLLTISHFSTSHRTLGSIVYTPIRGRRGIRDWKRREKMHLATCAASRSRAHAKENQLDICFSALLLLFTHVTTSYLCCDNARGCSLSFSVKVKNNYNCVSAPEFFFVPGQNAHLHFIPSLCSCR